MRCIYCGHELSQNASFCNQCGKPIPKNFNETTNIPYTHKKTWNHKHIILIVALILVVCVGVFYKGIYNKLINKDEISNEVVKPKDTLIQNEIQNESNKNELDKIVENKEQETTIEQSEIDSVVDVIVEDEVVQIRELYNKIVANIEEGTYSKTSLQDGSIIYYEDSEVRAIIVPKNVNDNSYQKSYYYYEDKLIFAYYEAKDAHRFYFYEENLMRWRYSQNASDAQNAINYDLEKTDQYLEWEYAVLEESNMLKNKISSIIKTQFNMNDITYASATSSLSEYNMTHSPERVFDGDISTAWVEGANGQGIGETVTIYFNKEYVLRGMLINAGYQKSSVIYEKNSRPKELKISFSDGSSQVYMLQDINGKQEIIFEEAVITEYISFTIQSVYQGNKYEDTVISELYFY